MSGGVDSSATAALLIEQGFDVIGITLKLWPQDCVNRAEDKCCGPQAVTDALTRHFGNHLPEIIVEPGRSLVGDAGVIQSEVILIADKGDGGDKRWVYLDVGKFNGLAETMDECIRYRIQAPGRSGVPTPVIIAGPTCDSADVLYETTPVHPPLALAEGDEVRIDARGAYSTCYSTVGFNGFAPLPTIITR